MAQGNMSNAPLGVHYLFGLLLFVSAVFYTIIATEHEVVITLVLGKLNLFK